MANGPQDRIAAGPGGGGDEPPEEEDDQEPPRSGRDSEVSQDRTDSRPRPSPGGSGSPDMGAPQDRTPPSSDTETTDADADAERSTGEVESSAPTPPGMGPAPSGGRDPAPRSGPTQTERTTTPDPSSDPEQDAGPRGRQRVGDTFTGEDPGGQGLEEGDTRLAERARQLEQQALEGTEGVSDPDHVAVRRFDDELRAVLTKSGQRAAVASQLDEEFDAEITSEDVELTSFGEGRLTEEAQREVAAEQLGEQVGVDLDPGDVERTDQGFVLSDDARTDAAAVLGGERLSRTAEAARSGVDTGISMGERPPPDFSTTGEGLETAELAREGQDVGPSMGAPRTVTVPAGALDPRERPGRGLAATAEQEAVTATDLPQRQPATTLTLPGVDLDLDPEAEAAVRAFAATAGGPAAARHLGTPDERTIEIPGRQDLGEQAEIVAPESTPVVGGEAVNVIPERVTFTPRDVAEASPVGLTRAAVSLTEGGVAGADQPDEVTVAELPQDVAGVPVAGAQLEEAGTAAARGVSETTARGASRVRLTESAGAPGGLSVPIPTTVGTEEEPRGTETPLAEGTATGMRAAGDLGAAPFGTVAATEEVVETGIGVAEGDVSVGDVAGQTGRVAVDAGEMVVDQPGRTAATLAVSGGVFAGTAAASSRLGAATRFAIQPGEELATAGLTRAAPGIARRFPNNRIDNEEIVLRGAARAGEAGARAASRAAQRVERIPHTAVGAAATASRARLRVTQAPESGLLEIDPALKAELARRLDQPTTTGEAARSRVTAPVDAARRLHDRTPTSPTELADVGRRAIDRQRQSLSDAQVAARSQTREFLAGLDESVRPTFDLQGRAIRTRDRIQATTREQLAAARFQASDLTTRALEAPGRARQAAADIVTRETLRRRLDLTEARVGLEVQARRTAAALRQKPTELRQQVPSVDDLTPEFDLTGPGLEVPSVREPVTRRLQAAEDAAFRARARASQDVQGKIAEARFLASSARARVTDTPSVDLSGRAFRTRERAMARLREKRAELRFQASQAIDFDMDLPSFDQPSNLRGLSDLTLRLEAREPTVMTTGEFDTLTGVEGGEEFPTGQLDLDDTTPAVEADVDHAVDTGSQQALLRTRTRSQDVAETGVGREFDLEGRPADVDRTGMRTEVPSDFLADAESPLVDLPGSDELSGVASGPTLDAPTDTRVSDVERQVVDQAERMVRQAEGSVESGVETGIEQTFEGGRRQRTETAVEQEDEQELELELEGEGELEVETETLLRDSTRRRRRRFDFGTFEKTFEAEVLDPATTAERAEATLDQDMDVDPVGDL